MITRRPPWPLFGVKENLTTDGPFFVALTDAQVLEMLGLPSKSKSEPDTIANSAGKRRPAGGKK